MNPLLIFIYRPIATLLITFAILLGGFLGWSMLPIAPLPQVEYPTVVISTFYPGADADIMSRTVTTPLENQLSKIEGTEDITSQSTAGASIITLRFGLNEKLDIAEQETQAAINNATSLLPSDLPTPPIYQPVNPADSPILTLSAISSSIPMSQVQDILATRLLPKLSQVSGVGAVNLEGYGRRAYRVQVNLPKLTSYGIAIDSLRTIIGTINVNSPTGTFDGKHYAVSLRMDGQIRNPQELLDQVIAYQNNGPIRLRDVANVVEGPENSHLAAWDGTETALVINIQKQPNSNVIQTVNNVKRMLPYFQSMLPAGIKLSVVSDRTVTIKASVDDVEFELVVAVLLVVLIVFVFLQTFAATAIPALTVPVSLVGSLGGLYLLGYSLDNLSLMALAIATGFIIDDAIVVIENIARHIENGDTPWDASIKGTKEICFTIISLTLSLIAVLIPLFFMQDLIGRIFHEFVVTLVLAILISGCVSLTLTPMLCARLLPPHNKELPFKAKQRGIFYKLQTTFNEWQESVISAYGRGLKLTFVYQRITLLIFFSCLVCTLIAGYFMPKSFFPQQDTGMISGVAQYSQDTSFTDMGKKQLQLNDIIGQDKDVAGLTAYTGVSSQNLSPDTAHMLINLVPHGKRTSSLDSILNRLRDDAAKQGVQLYLRPVQDISLNTSPSPLENQLVIQSTDAKVFNKFTPKLIESISNQPAISQVTSDYKQNGRQLNLNLNRSTAARYAITPQTVDNLLYDSFGQRQVSTIFTQANQYRIILEVTPELQQKGLEVLNELYLPGISGNSGESSSGPSRHPTSGLVPLKQVVQVSEANAPVVITHSEGFPASQVSFLTREGYSLSQGLEGINNAIKDLKLPASFHIKFEGATAAFNASTGSETALIVAAIIAIYIILGVLYESFIHPITIISTLPSAGLGALIGLWLWGMPLDMMGLIGIILLIGIVKKNAIMMIDFALACQREEHLAPREAIYKAAILRFRPIMMTTLAAIFGALPLMFGTGVGSELRRPLGVSIVTGLLLSQLLTLFTTPVLYLLLDGVPAYLKNKWRKLAGHS